MIKRKPLNTAEKKKDMHRLDPSGSSPANSSDAIKNDADTGFIIIAATRYAIGRQTYAPSLVVDWIKRHWKIINDTDKQTMFRDLNTEIERHEKSPTHGYLGADFDAVMWIKFKDWVGAELEKK